MADNKIKDNLSCFCPIPELCQMENNSANALRILEGETVYCVMVSAISAENTCKNQAAIVCLTAQLIDPLTPYFCRNCDTDNEANFDNLKVPKNVESKAIKFIDLTASSSPPLPQARQLSTSSNVNEDPRDSCACPIPSLCVLTNENLHILQTSSHSCCKCKKKVYGPCLGEQLDNPMSQFWCRACDDSTLSFNGSNIIQYVRDNLIKPNQVDNDAMDVDTDDKPDLIDPNCKNAQKPVSKSKKLSSHEELWSDCIRCLDTIGRIYSLFCFMKILITKNLCFYIFI